MPESINTLGLSVSANRQEMAAIQISLDETSVQIHNQCLIKPGITALTDLINSLTNQPGSIGYLVPESGSGTLFSKPRIISDKIQIPIHILVENIDTMKIVLVEKGTLFSILHIDISCFMRMLFNMVKRIYDTPVNIHAKIIPLGHFSQRLYKKLKDILPDVTDPWPKSVDNELVLEILRYALRRRIEEPDILLTVYYHLIRNISEHYVFYAKKFYIVGALCVYPWFTKIVSEYFQESMIFKQLNLPYQQALTAAVFAGLKQRGVTQKKLKTLEKSDLANYVILFV